MLTSEETSNLSYKTLLVEVIKAQFKIHAVEVNKYLNPGQEHIEGMVEPEQPPVIQLLDHLLSIIPTEASKNWTRMVAYLDLWLKLISSDDKLFVDYAFKREMIYRLIDFFLQKESPLYKKGETRTEMGNRTVQPKFTPLISTIGFLIRHAYTSTWTQQDHENGIIPTSFIPCKVTFNLTI